MICPYCGTNNPDDAKYCKNCGKEIESRIIDNAQEGVAHGPENTVAKTKYLILAGIATAVLIVALVVFFAVSKSQEDKTADSGASNQASEEVMDNELESGTDSTTNQDAGGDTATTMYVSSEEGLMLRKGPSTDTESIYVIGYGTEIKVEKVEDIWAYTTVDGLSGWCSMDYLVRDKSLIKQSESSPSSATDKNKLVEPANVANFGYHGIVDSKEGLNLRYGPGEGYDVIEVLPNGASVIERGWDGNWMYVDYNGKLGWVHTEYIRAQQGGKEKPAIYLYPTKTMDIKVKVELTEGRFTYTDPKGDGEWIVTAYPDGTLRDKASGKTYDYIFWESDDNTEYDWSEGYVVAGHDAESFLRRTLPRMGLNEKESAEFISYWLPRLKNNRYNLVTFQTDCYTDAAKLYVQPKADSVLRIFMVFRSINKPIKIKEPTITPFERRGFTVVEWGGEEQK